MTSTLPIRMRRNVLRGKESEKKKREVKEEKKGGSGRDTGYPVVWRETDPTGITRKKCGIPLVTFREKWFSHAEAVLFSLTPSIMTTTDEQMAITIRMGREEFEKFEQVLRWHELRGERRYTPDAYFTDMIEREYARVM